MFPSAVLDATVEVDNHVRWLHQVDRLAKTCAASCPAEASTSCFRCHLRRRLQSSSRSLSHRTQVVRRGTITINVEFMLLVDWARNL